MTTACTISSDRTIAWYPSMTSLLSMLTEESNEADVMTSRASVTFFSSFSMGLYRGKASVEVLREASVKRLKLSGNTKPM